ncbi:HAD domain-containing protein [Streptacidiphilus carbonis]|uniref:HAD domain-containing protein n=1 Tax=Streptacidiphilus carbonis TaxID=105422 RepID=UPI001EED01BE|nr:HAD domain-containing protein [Streptacidiphilus carbonis]
MPRRTGSTPTGGALTGSKPPGSAPPRSAPAGVRTRADKPLLYLDVDGVLNPVCPRPEGDFTIYRIQGSTVLISARHGTWLRELAEVYQLVWASTWEAYANLCIAPLLHLPELPFVPVGRRAGGDWLPIVRHAAGRPFAWVDDLIPEAVLRDSRARADRLLLPVDPGQGLRRSHVDRLLREPPIRPVV